MTEAATTDFSFLGREFLTWLWFKSEERNGAIMVPGTGDMSVCFLHRLVLESGEGDYSETILCKGFRTDLKEGKTAVREGKKIKEARIRLGIGSDEWEFTFKADAFLFQSMKLPGVPPYAQEEEKDREGQLLDRIYMTEKAVETMEKLFSLFLKKRIAPEWRSEEIPRIARWVGASVSKSS